jgi:hypothetical protein
MTCYDVTFVRLPDVLDLSTPSGRRMMHLLGATAEFERELIKVTAAIASAHRRGVRMAAPRSGLSADKVRALREAGMPWRTVAKRTEAGVGLRGALCRKNQLLDPGSIHGDPPAPLAVPRYIHVPRKWINLDHLLNLPRTLPPSSSTNQPGRCRYHRTARCAVFAIPERGARLDGSGPGHQEQSRSVGGGQGVHRRRK